jgi:hypothetical protein
MGRQGAAAVRVTRLPHVMHVIHGTPLCARRRFPDVEVPKKALALGFLTIEHVAAFVKCDSLGCTWLQQAATPCVLIAGSCRGMRC